MGTVNLIKNHIASEKQIQTIEEITMIAFDEKKLFSK
jgi:hypothetical protein